MKKQEQLYSSKSGRGVCEHRGQLYLHEEEVIIDVETGKYSYYGHRNNRGNR